MDKKLETWRYLIKYWYGGNVKKAMEQGRLGRKRALREKNTALVNKIDQDFFVLAILDREGVIPVKKGAPPGISRTPG